MHKISRLLAIERILTNSEISSQGQLIKKLKGEGISCTQATLSRNLRQLGVMRIPNGKGGYKYSLSGGSKPATANEFNIISVIKDIIDANSMIVMKTLPGHASSVAVIIDNSGRYEIAGTIAGDDTLLIIPRNNIDVSIVHTSLEMILPGLHKQVRGESDFKRAPKN
jgi:transcriptional regulator of arginine metabolism